MAARGTLVIDTERCKGCELCITACPPGVLTMSSEVNETGYRYPELHDGCTGCYTIKTSGTRHRQDHSRSAPQ